MNKREANALDRKKEHKGLSSLDERLIFDTMINYSEDTIYFKDLKSHFLFINAAQTARLRLDNPSSAIGKTDFDFFPHEQAQKAFEDEQKIIATATPILSNIEILKWPTGEINWVSVSKYPLYNSEHEIIGTWGVSRDITAQKNAEEELGKLNIQLNELNKNLKSLSLIDPLSGLYNRRYFSEIMKKTFDDYKMKILEGIYSNFSICVSDIDLFKKVNDSFGHLAGDDIIKHVGNIIKASIRDTDIAFRYGGDEFVILFHDVNKNDAGEIALRLNRTIMESPVISSVGEINITISMGISSVDEAIDVNDLLDKADKRLYLSKKNGRNMVTL
jgi:diguanylate cyclase (GGDEF)-like protein/PAS domain S-box-containing protein